MYRSQLLTSRGIDILVRSEIDRLERKLQNRSPTLRLTGESSAPNPAYIEIAQKLDSLRAVLKTGDDRNRDSLPAELSRAETHLTQLKNEFYPLRREHDEFVERYNLEREDLVLQVESLRSAYEINIRDQLTNRVKIASLRPALYNLEARIKGNKKALSQIQVRLRQVGGETLVTAQSARSAQQKPANLPGHIRSISALLEQPESPAKKRPATSRSSRRRSRRASSHRSPQNRKPRSVAL